MPERDKASQAAVAVSVGAAITAAIALLNNRAQASPTDSQIFSLDEATINLLVAIAQASSNIDSNTLAALTKLQGIIDTIVTGAPGGQGWPPNAAGVRILTVLCAVVATPYPVSYMEIPDGMALAIKSSPFNAIGSIIFVAKSPAECLNPNSAWPLALNESITYFVKNANSLNVSTNVAGSIAVFTAEQRS